MHVPAARNDTVDPVNEQTVPAPDNSANTGVSPDDAVAVIAYVPPGNGRAGTDDDLAGVAL